MSPGGGDAEVAPEPARRAAVVGDAHDRGDLTGVLAHRAERGGEAVTATEGDDAAAPSATFDVAVVNTRRHAERFEQSGELGRDHDAAMSTAGAADADRQVRLAFAHVRGEQQREQPLQLVEERRGLGLCQHVVAHRVGRYR